MPTRGTSGHGAGEQLSRFKRFELFARFCVRSDAAPPSLPPDRPTRDSDGGVSPRSLPLPRDAAVHFQPLFTFSWRFCCVAELHADSAAGLVGHLKLIFRRGSKVCQACTWDLLFL